MNASCMRAPMALRAGASDAAIEGTIRETWSEREDRYCERRAAGIGAGVPPRMSFLGG
jgi:hypothetical protein